MSRVQEDPDELGYWIGERPNPALLSSLIVCNSIVPKHEQAEIAQAAALAHEGQDIQAERNRFFAGYGNVGFRDDADRRADIR